MDSLVGKLAIITGGSSGIGFAAARCLLEDGVRVQLLARRLNVLENARVALLNQTGREEGAVGICPVDVTDFPQVKAMIDEIIARAGTPDLLINSAGITYPGEFMSLDMEVFHSLMEVNYFGTVNLIRAVLPAMLEKKGGHIVNISSVAGFLGTYGYSAYGASKYAVRGLSDVLRAELKPKGICVSVVFPPDTQTPQLEWEEAYKPAITRELASTAKVMSAEAVAKEILHGIKKRKYLILPGLESKLFYFLDHLPGNLVYPVMDILIRSAIKKIDRQQVKKNE